MGIPITIRLLKGHRASLDVPRESELSRFQNSSGLSIFLPILQSEYQPSNPLDYLKPIGGSLDVPQGFYIIYAFNRVFISIMQLWCYNEVVVNCIMQNA